jgi:hypothetical protein
MSTYATLKQGSAKAHKLPLEQRPYCFIQFKDGLALVSSLLLLFKSPDRIFLGH